MSAQQKKKLAAVIIFGLIIWFCPHTEEITPIAWHLFAIFAATILGFRISFLIIKAIGKSSLTLGYAITLSDFVISPATPSSTARAGGIIYPIIRSLSTALGSEPGETRRKFGAYIMQIKRCS